MSRQSEQLSQAEAQHWSEHLLADHGARGLNRILLSVATGTGKHPSPFQIIWKLFRSGWNVAG